MAAFPDVVIYHFVADQIQAHEEMKQWIQKSACVFRGKCIGGLDRDQPYPQERSNPGLEQLLLIGRQQRASPAGWKNMYPFKVQTYSTA